MAGGGDLMDGDLEDGEISGSGSDTEMGTAQVPAAFSGQSFHNRAAVQPSAASYRSGNKPVSSDSDQDSSDEDSTVWRHKRLKASNDAQPPPSSTATRPEPTRMDVPNAPGGRKVNNIWGSVVQEQCQDAVAAELGIFGMEGEFSMSSRNVETYNFVLARKIMDKERELEKLANKDGEVNMLDTDLEDCMKERGSEEKSGGDTKRKRSVKERIGPRAEMDTKGRYVVTEDDLEDRVTDEIAYRLREPKKDLIERIVKVIGNKKAIELLGETATLEENGGVFTMDGSRRRTPGGVYLYLLKNTPSISKGQIKKIFFEEQHNDCKSKKAAQKRRRNMVAKKMKQAIGTLNLQEHDDVSRETFASDTNEALESLEDAGEEEEGQEESASGIEETAVVYNAADLEVF
ncbi:phosphorylated adapter RNA export protein [Trematomus bernacchii]|uniref:phosphorylated adapter RNA export protein n=1 Tax=Trematomus bernacchii TaxID=40690 RepID=UPI00146AC03A|nr:phosphorylated adapter RNA export protein [Trematomus bernacchii]XP_033987419.1 phosphorylated adapter RNA export protein [Trematomus bernacchii]